MIDVAVRVTHGVIWSHISAFKQNLADPQDFYSSVSNELSDRDRLCGTRGFQEQGQCLFIGLADRSIFVSYCFSLSLSFYGLVLGGVFWVIGCKSLSHSQALKTFFNNNNNNNTDGIGMSVISECTLFTSKGGNFQLL